MKNELGDVPKISLEDEEISIEDKVSKKEDIQVKVEEAPNIVEENNKPQKEKPVSNVNYYTGKDKMNKILTIVLIAALAIIIVLLLVFGIKKIVDNIKLKKAEAENKKLSEQIGIDLAPGEIDLDGNLIDPILLDEPEIDSNANLLKKVYYKGFEVVGYIRIPKTGINYPILKPMTNKSLEASVALEYTMGGVNKVGNTTISGHNYKNAQFFANNYRIQIGDSIFIKDMTGQELKYDVYDIRELSESDKSFVQRNTNGAIEVTLSTCTDNVINRTVIFAKHNPR